METLVFVGIFLGIALSVVGFLMLLKYRNYENDKMAVVDEKIEKLNSTLDACDRMVEELNKLSDYIITNVEEKSIELKSMIDMADKKINEINSQTYSVIKSTPLRSTNVSEKSVEIVTEEPKKKTTRTRKKAAEEIQKPPETINIPAINAYTATKSFAKEIEEKREEPKFILDTFMVDSENRENAKMFAFVVNPKAKEVIELSNQGLDTTEIAKRLGIGKGEIELILGLKK